MTSTLRDDLLARHLSSSLDVERTRRFSSPARHEEYRLLAPPEVSYSTAGFPVQIWRPYADRRLHEFLLSIPPEHKFAPHPDTDEQYAGSKGIVRRGLKGVLPESVRTRTSKTHFASLFEDELHRRWSEYEAAFGPSGRSELSERGYADKALFWRRLGQVRENGWGTDLIFLMRALWLETWLRAIQLPRAHATTVATRRGASELGLARRDPSGVTNAHP
jgi:asparagine synthase (glutamine-hydrolysing)